MLDLRKTVVLWLNLIKVLLRMVKSGCLLVLSSQKKVPNHFRKSTCKLSHNKLRTMKENSQELIFHFNARCFAWGES